MILFCFHFRKIQDGRHYIINGDFLKYGSIFLKYCTNIPPGVHTILCCFHILEKIQYGRYGRHFDFFSRKYVTTTTPPEPQVIETWGFHHKTQFRLKSLPF